MKAYQTHPQTGEFTGEVKAQRDPMGGGWILPGGAVDQAPPETGPSQAARWSGSAWEVVEDHRGRKYWTDNGDEHEMRDLGPMPADARDTPPPPPTAEAQAAADAERIEQTARDVAAALGLNVPADVAVNAQARAQAKRGLK